LRRGRKAESRKKTRKGEERRRSIGKEEGRNREYRKERGRDRIRKMGKEREAKTLAAFEGQNCATGTSVLRLYMH